MAIALAGFAASDAIIKAKRSSDTISVTGSARQALDAATHNAKERAETIVRNLGGKLGKVRSAQLGVYQVVPRNSTDVSDYGFNVTSSRDKDVVSVVTLTFAVS